MPQVNNACPHPAVAGRSLHCGETEAWSHAIDSGLALAKSSLVKSKPAKSVFRNA
jgi:hypothetical protein